MVLRVPLYELSINKNISNYFVINGVIICNFFVNYFNLSCTAYYLVII